MYIYMDYLNFWYFWELKRLHHNWRTVYLSSVIRNLGRDKLYHDALIVCLT